jgi:DNA-binding beta-propeller fold protein YncE
MMLKSIRFLVFAIVACALATAQAEEKITVVLEGLHNPTGIAKQPGTGHLFVADSGAGKVIRIVDGKAQDVITDFSLDIYGKGPQYKIGPLGLAFIDENTLVVADGSKVDKEETINIYEVPKAGEAAIKADAAKAKLGPLDNDEKLLAEGNYYAVVVTKEGIYATANGDDTKGWIVRAEIKGDGSYGPLERYLSTKEATNVDAPVGMTLSERGELVVGQMGEISVVGDGLVTFYNPKTKKMLLNLETGLSDITGVVYSPKGHLYAVDFAWAKPEDGGLFRLDAKTEDGAQVVEPKKITALKKPTALCFGDDGAMYITIFNESEGDQEGADAAKAKTGQVIKLEPGL